MRYVNKHIIHCSDSTHGNVTKIRKWHKEKGWRDIGYHFVILPNGVVELGRPLEQSGAHCKGYNKTSIGTCLIGVNNFTQAQFASLQNLHHTLGALFPNIQPYAHNEFSKRKTCPNFNVKDVLK